MSWRIPLADLELGQEEIDAVVGVLRSKWLSMGGVTQKLERAFAEFLGVKHAFGTTNATAALHMAHAALGLGTGDEVVVPSLTFVATSNSVLYTGAKPVFAEIGGPDDLNISPADVERRITAKTRALTVMHYGGYPCEMDELLGIARRHGLAVVEDAAHAPGAVYKGRKAGTLGDVACFSFFANKHIATGEGGMLVTNRDDVAERVRLMRSHGMTALTWDRHHGHAHSYDVVSAGYNYRIDEMRSALGLVQLNRLEESNRRRRRLVDSYRQALSGLDGVSLPFCGHAHTSSNHLFPVLLEDPARRLEFIQSLKREGIQTSIHYPPIHLFTYYRELFGYAAGDLPVTEDVCAREVTLPLYPAMTEQDVQTVVAAVRRALG